MKMLAALLCSGAIFLGVTSAMAQSSASTFLTDAMKGDNSEIKLGELAEARGNSEGIRDFGQTLVTDHTQAKQAVSNAASAMGITPTDDPTPEALAEYTKLNSLTGPSFDHEFARYMVSDHQKDIRKFEAQAKSGDKTGTLAQQQLPTLRKHLAIARSLEKSDPAK